MRLLYRIDGTLTVANMYKKECTVNTVLNKTVQKMCAVKKIQKR